MFGRICRNCLVGLLAAQPRHRHIEQNEHNLVATSAEHLDALLAVNGGEHAEAERRERLRGNVADNGFVINDENRAGAWSWRRSARRTQLASFHGGEKHLERRAAAGSL